MPSVRIMYTNTAIMTYNTNTQERGSTNDRDYKLLFFFKKKKKANMVLPLRIQPI